MHKILRIEPIGNLLTMDIEDSFSQTIAGCFAKDNHDNIVKITSAAMLDGTSVVQNNTTIVIEVVKKIAPWGNALSVTF